LYFIKKELGFGIVRKRLDGFFQYYVSDQRNIHRLVCLFNGNLQLEKTKMRFSKWFKAYNSYQKIEKKLSYLKESKKKIFLNNGWLSGFIDAEGCFSASLIKDKTRRGGLRLRLRFFIDQKDESEVLLKIKNFIGGSLVKRKELEGMERIVLYSSFNTLLNYLNLYSLKTIKALSLKRWVRLLPFVPQEKLFQVVSNKFSFKKMVRLIKTINSSSKRYSPDIKEI
jgi:hypothetical protein